MTDYSSLSNDELVAAYKRAGADFAKAEGMEKGIKVILNAAYGATSNEYFRFFDDRLAEAITLSGQLSVRWVAGELNAFLNHTLGTEGVDYAIALDTDSCYLNLEAVVARACKLNDTHDIVNWVDKLAEKRIQPVIDRAYEELARMMNAFDQKMKMKRETIANKGIWVAKKRYILNSYNDEGVAYEEPEIKITGIEAVRSTTPEVCREKIKDALRVVMNEGESATTAFIAKFKEEFFTLPFEEVAFPTGVNGVDEYADATTVYRKGTPIHVKAALNFNHALKTHRLSNVTPIKSGDKIRYVHLKQPNPFHEEVIAVGSEMPEVLEIQKYIDYHKQFDKTFMAPLKNILDVVGWQAEKKPTLDL